MKAKLTRLLAVLMSVLMFAVPTLAGAEAEGAYFVISDPTLSVQGATLDFTGLAVELDAEQAEELMSFALRILANDNSALTAHVAAGQEGIKAYLEGMSHAFVVTPETIQQLMSQALESVPMANNIMNFDPENLFTEEAMDKFMTTVQEIVAEVISGEPVEDSFTTLAGDEVQASRIDFELTNEQMASFVRATAELIESNPDLASQISAALEEQGVEGSFADTAASSVQNAGLSINGSIYMSTESQDYRVTGGIVAEEETVPYTVDVSVSEEGMMVVGSLHQPDDGSEEIRFQISLLPNEQLEGEVDFLADFGLYDTNDEGESEPEVYLSYVITAEASESGDITRLFLLNANAEDNVIDVTGSCTMGAESEEVFFTFSATTGDDTAVVSLTYNGAPFENETTSGHAGTLKAAMSAQGQSLTAQANIEFGKGLPESIAFDFSGVDTVDVTTLDDDSMEEISNDAMGAVQNALGALMSVPGIADLLSSMQTEG